MSSQGPDIAKRSRGVAPITRICERCAKRLGTQPDIRCTFEPGHSRCERCVVIRHTCAPVPTRARPALQLVVDAHLAHATEVAAVRANRGDDAKVARLLQVLKLRCRTLSRLCNRVRDKFRVKSGGKNKKWPPMEAFANALVLELRRIGDQVEGLHDAFRYSQRLPPIVPDEEDFLGLESDEEEVESQGGGGAAAPGEEATMANTEMAD